MKKKTRKLIQDIIDEKYLCDWEFIVNEIAPEVEEGEFDVDEVCEMIAQENLKRRVEDS